MARRAVKARADMVQACEIDDTFGMGNSTRTGYRHAIKINQLVFDELVTVPDRIEHFADRNRSGRVLSYLTSAPMGPNSGIS